MIPPAIGVGNAVATETDSGNTVLRFEVGIVGEHSEPVSVSYVTRSGNGQNTGFVPTSGTLTWAAGDTASQFVEVTVNGDTDFEEDQLVILSLRNPVSSVIRIGNGYGYVLNDDPAAVGTEPGQTDGSDVRIGLTRSELSIVQNAQVVSQGQFALGTDVSIAGHLTADNNFAFEFFSPNIRADRFALTGGTGQDSINITGGQFSTGVYGKTDGQTGQIFFEDQSGTRAVLDWQNIETIAADAGSIDTLQIRLASDVTSAVLEDADAIETGLMQMRINGNVQVPLTFVNPDSSITIVSFNPDLAFSVNSLDSDFTGSVNVVQGGAQLNAASVLKGAAAGTLVAALITEDPLFAGDFITSLVSGSGDAGNSFFTIEDNQLKVLQDTSGVEGATLSIRVQTTNSVGDAVEQVFEIELQDSTSDITLSGSTITENEAAGVTVGQLIGVIPGGTGPYTYTTIGGDGDTNNDGFSVFGDLLRTSDVFDFEVTPTLSVRIRATDQTGLFVEKAFTITVTNVTELSGIDVQNGQTQRSFVNAVDILFDQSSDLLTLLDNNRIQLTRRDLNGNNPFVMAIPTSSVQGNNIRLDFGAQGIGGNRNSNAGDGYYEIAVDLDGDGTFESKRNFYRLLGDVNGDGKVDASDTSLILGSFGTTNRERDTNGDGIVNAIDRILSIRGIGRKLKDGLFVDD